MFSREPTNGVQTGTPSKGVQTGMPTKGVPPEPATPQRRYPVRKCNVTLVCNRSWVPVLFCVLYKCYMIIIEDFLTIIENFDAKHTFSILYNN